MADTTISNLSPLSVASGLLLPVSDGSSTGRVSIANINSLAPVQSVAGKTGTVTLTNSDVGLGNVTNDAQLKIASNLSDLNNITTAKSNLGLAAIASSGKASDLNNDVGFVALKTETALNVSSGNTALFSNISSTAKRITLMFKGITASGTSDSYFSIRLGTASQGLIVANYNCWRLNWNNNGGSYTIVTDGFSIDHVFGTTNSCHGYATLTKMTGNIWSMFGMGGNSGSLGHLTTGHLDCTTTLDRIALVNVTSNFTNGTVNIIVES